MVAPSRPDCRELSAATSSSPSSFNLLPERSSGRISTPRLQVSSMVYVARSPTNIAVRSTDDLTTTSVLCATTVTTVITSSTKTTKPRNHETVRSAKELVKKYDVERRTRRTRRKTLNIFLCGFRGFCVVRDLFTISLKPSRYI